MSPQVWQSTDDHAPAAAPPAAGAPVWQTTDDHSAAAPPAVPHRDMWDSLSDLGSAFWEGSGGKALVDMMGGASRDPALAQKSLDTAKALVKGIANEPARIWDQLKQSGQSMVTGHPSDAVYHLAGAVPLVGGAAQNVATDFDNGDYAKGFGHALGLLLPFAATAVKLPPEVKIPGLGAANATEGAAMQFLSDKGVPVPAGAATGNPFVRGVQNLADRTIGGSVVGQIAQRQTTNALQRTAAEFVANQAPDISAETHYANFRQAEASPTNARTVATGELGPGGAPKTAPMQMPVPVGQLKPMLEPIYEEMQWMPASDRSASAGYQAVKKIIEGPDYIPASQAEIGLGGIKKMAREDVGRNAGVAKFIVPKLQDLIDGTVSDIGGAKAVDALQQGRISAAAEAGRDWLTDEFKKAEAQGGFNREAGLWADWQRLRDEAKQTMFTPATIADLDKFFLGAKKLAENPNPSGSGYVAAIGAQGAYTFMHPITGIPLQIGAAGLAKLLHSPTFARILTDGITIPLGSRQAAMAGSALSRMAEETGTGRPLEPPEPPDTTPPPVPPAPPAGQPGAPGAPAAATTAADPYTVWRNANFTRAPGGYWEENSTGQLFTDERLHEFHQTHLAPSTSTPLTPPAASGTVPTGAPNAQASDARGSGEGQALPGAPASRSSPGPRAPLQTQITIPGTDASYPATYQVRELADIQPSHSGVSFEPNPKYQLRNDRDYTRPENQGKVVAGGGRQFDPRFMLTDNPDASNGPPVIDSTGNVYGGNGRSMMLQRVYGTNPQGAVAYKKLLGLKAEQFGLDPQQVAGMKQPVLVRVIPDEAMATADARQNAVTDFNKVATAALKPSEQAIADSRRVSPETLDHISLRLEQTGPDATLPQILEGSSGTAILDRMIKDGVITPQERAAYATENQLTDAGKMRIQRLVLGRFFSDPAQLDNLAPAIRNKVERIAAPLSRLEESPEWSLSGDLQNAFQLIEKARSHGLNLQDELSQGGLFAGQEVGARAIRLAELLQKAKPGQLTQAVREYAARQHYAATYQGPGLANEYPDPQTPAQAFDELLAGKLAPVAKKVKPDAKAPLIFGQPPQ